MNLDFSNLEKIASSHGLRGSDFDEYEKKISEYLSKIAQRKQGFVEILDDGETIEKIEFFANAVKGKYTDIVLLGIGGSALGAKALRDAFPTSDINLYILDNVDPEVIAETEKALDFSKTLFLVISKSGNTAETLTQYEYFADKISVENLVFITGQTGKLREIADQKDILTFDVPENIEGRFSVLSVVGLLPVALWGIDICALISGAKEMSGRFISPDFEKNTPFQLALIQYLLSQKNISQNVLMPYSSKLKSFAEWCVQLLAESTGKKEKGITPLASQGATDQHSLLQLLTQGPNDKLTIFMEIENFKGEKVFANLLRTELQATADSLTELDRPNVTLRIKEISPETLGQLFFLFEGATAFLGEFLGINTFDQPGVERSKELTRRYLK